MGVLLMKKRIFVLFVLLAIVPVALAYTEVIESEGNIGTDNSIYVDNEGKQHILHRDQTNYSLRYCTNMNGDWECETIGHGSFLYGKYSDIVIDSNQKAHISLYAGMVVNYCNNMNGDWECVDLNSFPAMYWTAIELDDEENVHLTYASYDTGIMYCTNKNGDWECSQVENFDPSGNFVLGKDIKVDNKGIVHLTYSTEIIDGWTNMGDFLRHCWLIDKEWECETIMELDRFSYPLNMDIDEEGYLYVVYNHKKRYNNEWISNAGLCTDNNRQNKWMCYLIEKGGDDVEIDIDRDGKARIVHYNADEGELRLCSRGKESRYFRCDTIAEYEGDDYYAHCSIDTDNQNKVHISYYNAEEGDLVYYSDKLPPIYLMGL